MHGLGWIVVALAVVHGGWLAFDGAHGLVTGDYVTPRTGRHAGRLGPWARLVAAAGIPPRSTGMMVAHVVLGAATLLAAAAFALQLAGSWWAVCTCAVLGLWYLPFGTLLCLLQVALLATPALRAGAGS